MRKIAIVVGSDVGPKGRRKLARWRWVRVDPGFTAVEAVETLQPALVVVKEVERPAAVVASVRAVAPGAVVMVLAARFDRTEGAAVLEAGADCYRNARSGSVDEEAIIEAAELARRRAAAAPRARAVLH